MRIELTFTLNLWYEIGDTGQEIFPITPAMLTPEMLKIIKGIVYPYQPVNIQLDQSDIYVDIDYHEIDFLEIGSWFDGIDVNRNAPDGWMEGNLELKEYPGAEFVPTLISARLDF